jgi:hypothetical protein
MVDNCSPRTAPRSVRRRRQVRSRTARRIANATPTTPLRHVLGDLHQGRGDELARPDAPRQCRRHAGTRVRRGSTAEPLQTECDARATADDPHRGLSDPNQRLSDPHRRLSDPNQSLSDPNQSLSDSNQRLSDSNQRLSDPRRTWTSLVRAPTSLDVRQPWRVGPRRQVVGQSAFVDEAIGVSVLQGRANGERVG